MDLCTDSAACAAPAFPILHLEGSSLPDPSIAWRVLEEIDYGLILVNPDGCLQHANRLARGELDRSQFLRIQGRTVTSQSPLQSDELVRAIRQAARGSRRMLDLRFARETLTLACVPLFGAEQGECASVLLMLGRLKGSQNFALAFFARENRLSTTEEAVLRALCGGQDIQDIAAARAVSESTLRSQIRSLRDKTGCGSIRHLVQCVAALPPLVPCWLRGHAASQ